MAEIKFAEVTKIYPDGTEAVSSVDLDIADGSLMVLVGPSGCGKTTLLRMVAGLEDITDGEIKVGERVINDVDPKNRDLAMVFQNYALYPHMTCYDNMAFGLKLRKVPKSEIKRRVNETAKALGLEDQLKKKPRALSGGQRQRVAMGRAIVREPKAFLMDEPLSNLDAKLRVQMRTEISRIQRDLGVTMIYVTHDQTEAMTMGDQVAVMNRGVLQQVDPPQEMYDHPANLFVAGFIGSPAMNLVGGELVNDPDGVHVKFGGMTLPLPPSALEARPGLRDYFGKRVVIGIRPEDIEHPDYVPDPTPGSLIHVTVDVREAMGAEIYAHFRVDEPPLESEHIRDLADDEGHVHEELAASDGTPKTPFVARLNSHAPAAEGEPLTLWVDMRSLHMFDPDTGLTIS